MINKKNTYHVPLPPVDVRFDTNAFDHRVRSHGIPLIHYRAMRSPGGMTDLYDIRSPEDDNLGSSNGFLYTKAGQVTCLFAGNQMRTDVADVGMMDHSTVSVTAPRHYDSQGEGLEPVRAYVLPFDRFYLAAESVLVPNWELVESHITGVDKLNYPAVEVQDLVDSSGGRYIQGEDFDLRAGQVAWRPGKGPMGSAEANKSTIYCVRYLYRPYFYVRNMVHEVRVAIDKDCSVSQMNQAFVLQREFIFENANKDEDSELPDNPRQARSPSDGSFGPR